MRKRRLLITPGWDQLAGSWFLPERPLRCPRICVLQCHLVAAARTQGKTKKIRGGGGLAHFYLITGRKKKRQQILTHQLLK